MFHSSVWYIKTTERNHILLKQKAWTHIHMTSSTFPPHKHDPVIVFSCLYFLKEHNIYCSVVVSASLCCSFSCETSSETERKSCPGSPLCWATLPPGVQQRKTSSLTLSLCSVLVKMRADGVYSVYLWQLDIFLLYVKCLKILLVYAGCLCNWSESEEGLELIFLL